MVQRNASDTTEVKKRGRPRKDADRKDFNVVQIRMYKEPFARFEKARKETPIVNRSEFCRVLLDEALKARGF